MILWENIALLKLFHFLKISIKIKLFHSTTHLKSKEQDVAQQLKMIFSVKVAFYIFEEPNILIFVSIDMI